MEAPEFSALFGRRPQPEESGWYLHWSGDEAAPQIFKVYVEEPGGTRAWSPKTTRFYAVDELLGEWIGPIPSKRDEL